MRTILLLLAGILIGAGTLTFANQSHVVSLFNSESDEIVSIELVDGKIEIIKEVFPQDPNLYIDHGGRVYSGTLIAWDPTPYVSKIILAASGDEIVISSRTKGKIIPEKVIPESYEWEAAQ